MLDFTATEKETIESEKSVIGIMLMEPEESKRVYDTLTAKMFYSEQLGIIFNCCKKLTAKGIRADVVTVTDKLGADYKAIVLNCAETVPSISALDSYINGVLDSWRCRSIRTKLNEMCESGADADSMTADLSTLLKEQERIIAHQSEATNKPYKQCVLEFMNWMQLPDTSIKTGWGVIDKRTGGLQRGCVTVIAARPGCGKTTMGLQLATNVAREYKVLYISLEMPAVQLTRNIVARFAGVDSQRISAKDLTEQEQTDVARGTQYLYDELKLVINDSESMTVNDIETAVKGVKPDLVVIDHIRLITPLNSRKSEFEASADNTHALKRIAKEYNINVVELVQAKRESEGRVPQMSDLFGGAATEQDADMVIGICPESEYQDKELCSIEVGITKNRHGAGGSFQFAWNRPQCGMYSAEKNLL